METTGLQWRTSETESEDEVEPYDQQEKEDGSRGKKLSSQKKKKKLWELKIVRQQASAKFWVCFNSDSDLCALTHVSSYYN